VTKTIDSAFANHILLAQKTLQLFSRDILDVSSTLASCLRSGGTIFWCGNGGSCADALHLSAELVGRLDIIRPPYRSLPLSSDPCSLTCISNDFGFNHIFSRQLESLASPGDVLVTLSTSGNSPNIIHALEAASRLSLKSIAFLGKTGGPSSAISDLKIIIPSVDTARIQEMHMLIGHVVCKLVQDSLQTDS